MSLSLNAAHNVSSNSIPRKLSQNLSRPAIKAGSTILSLCYFALALAIFHTIVLQGTVFADDATDSALTSSSNGMDVGVDEADIQAAEEEIYDPIEPVNRGIFWFNDQLDIYFLEPVARGYKFVLPKPVRKGVTNFFSNLRYPVNFVNDLFQLKFSDAAEETGRFLINTTIGVVGLVDVASDMGLEKGYNDFGLTFAYYGMPPGPYIVIPVLGPSNLRDLTGKVGDTLSHPTMYPYYINATTKDFRDWESRSTTVLEGLNRRASLINAIESAKETSLDYYSFIQATYYQVRHGLLVENEERGQDSQDAVEEQPAVNK